MNNTGWKANKESDLYIPVKRFFESNGFEVYSEIEVPYSGGRVDVVANNAPAPIAIELKTSLSMGLIEQAVDRKNVFPYVYIAIPMKKRGQVPRWVVQYLRAQKIGLLMVGESGRVHMPLAAKYDKAPMGDRVDWGSILNPNYKEWVPGGHNGGGFVTQYKVTMIGVKNYLKKCRKVDDVVQQNSGTEWKQGWRPLSEILDHCETHYMHPKPSLAKALLEYDNPWLEAKKINNKWHFRYKEGGEDGAISETVTD